MNTPTVMISRLFFSVHSKTKLKSTVHPHDRWKIVSMNKQKYSNKYCFNDNGISGEVCWKLWACFFIQLFSNFFCSHFCSLRASAENVNFLINFCNFAKENFRAKNVFPQFNFPIFQNSIFHFFRSFLFFQDQISIFWAFFKD